MTPTLAVKRSANSPRVRSRCSCVSRRRVVVDEPRAHHSLHGGNNGDSLPLDERIDHHAGERHRAVEVGVRFQTSVAGTVTALRYYKPANSPVGTKSGHLWSAAGALLASVTFNGETASGWQTANLAQPVALATNTMYTVSYFAPKGGYAATHPVLLEWAGRERTAHRAGATNGFYSYGAAPSYPNTNFWRSPNYWADVVFTPGGTTHDDDDHMPPRRRRGRRRRRRNRQ